MKNTQTSDKKKFKIRVLDIVIVLLVIASIAGVYFRYNLIDVLTGAKNLDDYAISFSIKDVRYTTEAYFNIGDKVWFADGGDEIGTLMEASDDSKNALIVVPATKTFLTEGNSRVIDVPYPVNTRIDATGRISCKGSYTAESGFLLGGKTHIASGDRFTVKTELVTVIIEGTSISLIED